MLNHASAFAGGLELKTQMCSSSGWQILPRSGIHMIGRNSLDEQQQLQLCVQVQEALLVNLDETVYRIQALQISSG